MTASVFNNSEGESLFNSSAFLLEDVARSSLSFRVAPIHINDMNAHLTMEGTADSCKVEKGIFGNVIMKIAQESLAKYSNAKIQCNMPKGFYYSANLKIDDSLMPIHIFGQKFKFIIDLTFKSRVTIGKPLVDIFSFQFKGIAM